MRKLVVVDCGSGNLHSVQAGLARAAADAWEIVVTQEAGMLDAADRIVLPGVGAFADCMRGLESLSGMRSKLEERVLKQGVPFLGICVGMQMMLERSFEHGEHPGLGWIAGEVVPIRPADPSLKIPHMGWNELHLATPKHPLFEGVEEGEHVYFVHSYHARCRDESQVLATVEYGELLTASIGYANLAGTQFHPEKSHKTGEKLLRNFLEWQP